jgi:glutamine amidotransferase
MITLVDYGLGNIQAFANIYKSIGIACSTARHADELSRASRLILPGVGAFDWAMQRLDASGLRPVLDDLVLNQGVPVLGICVGMQMMANHSEEGHLPGLGWIPGRVKRFDASSLSAKTGLPHMGWNNIAPKEHPLFVNISDPRFYFLHSYYFLPGSEEQVLAETEYGESFASAVCRENVIGVQFHPEKSHHWGIQLLQNFAETHP